jgi:hypothetical protein
VGDDCAPHYGDGPTVPGARALVTRPALGLATGVVRSGSVHPTGQQQIPSHRHSQPAPPEGIKEQHKTPYTARLFGFNTYRRVPGILNTKKTWGEQKKTSLTWAFG